MPRHSPAFVNSCHQITKGVAVKTVRGSFHSRVFEMLTNSDVGLFEKRELHYLFEEKQMHHSKSEIKGIPLFSTHWLHFYYCLNGPWMIFVTFVNSLNFILQNLYTFLLLLSKRAKFFCWPFCQTTIFIFPTKPEVDFKNKRWCALRCIKPELLAFKFWKSVHLLPSYVETTLWHT